MPRYRMVVGVIQCRADAATISTIAAASGLCAEPGDGPDLFHLTDCGRDVEPDIGPDLFGVAKEALDHAVRTGTIPGWSMVRAEGTAA